MQPAPAGSTAPGRRLTQAGQGGADDTARWEAAAQIRGERPGWVVIWVARKGEFQARPLFRARPGTVATAATPKGLTAQMDSIEQAAQPRR